MNVKSLLTHPDVRFKSMGEMTQQYGTLWPENIMRLDTNDVMTTMSLYAGKILHPSLVVTFNSKIIGNTYFLYGPSMVRVHINMITVRALPKIDCWGNIIKPGNIVKCEYLIISPAESQLVSQDLRNEPGTLVRVLRVAKPAEYLVDSAGYDKNRINKYCIATELIAPKSGGFIDQIQKTYSIFFKDGIVRAFEVMHRTAKAKDFEKEFYHKVTRG